MKLSQMTEEFGRVVGALEHLQGFVTSLQAKAGMPPPRPASSAAFYPSYDDVEPEKRERVPRNDIFCYTYIPIFILFYFSLFSLVESDL